MSGLVTICILLMAINFVTLWLVIELHWKVAELKPKDPLKEQEMK